MDIPLNKKQKVSMDKSSEDGGICVKLFDSSLMDCSICFKPLSTPIYQCPSGHIMCYPCHSRHRKCPKYFCSTRLGGSIRNQPLENLIASLRLHCKYNSSGCSELLPYSSKSTHEQTCDLAPFKCPFKDCSYFESPPELYSHLKQNHERSVVRLKPDGSSVATFSMSKADKFIVFLQEEGAGNGSIYVLDYNTMRVRYVSDRNNVAKQGFTMAVQHKCSTFVFDLEMVKMAQVSGADASAALKLIQILDQFFENGNISFRVLNKSLQSS